MTYASWILLLALPSIVQASLWRRNNAGGKQPNFVYIITDDQWVPKFSFSGNATDFDVFRRDAATANPDIMPKTAKWFSSGSNYTSFYSPISVCCPSRVVRFPPLRTDEDSEVTISIAVLLYLSVCTQP